MVRQENTLRRSTKSNRMNATTRRLIWQLYGQNTPTGVIARQLGIAECMVVRALGR